MKQLVICVLLSILPCLVGSNNSSELSAIGEALIWLRDNREETKHYTDVVINYDSEYAAKTITGV